MKWIRLVLLALLLGGCLPPPKPPRSPLEIRAIQTREYQTKDTRMVMKALLNVLQDEGYVTKNAVVDLGLVTATKEIDLEDRNSAMLHAFLGGPHDTWPKSSQIEATANVSEFGNETRLRVTFQRKILDNRGGIHQVEPIEDPKFYQDFLSKVDQGIFIQREKL